MFVHISLRGCSQSLRFFFLKLELKKCPASGGMEEEGGVEVASLEFSNVTKRRVK